MSACMALHTTSQHKTNKKMKQGRKGPSLHPVPSMVARNVIQQKIFGRKIFSCTYYIGESAKMFSSVFQIVLRPGNCYNKL